MIPLFTLLIAIGAGIMAVFAWELYRDLKEERRESEPEVEVIASENGKPLLTDQPLKIVTATGLVATDAAETKREIEGIETVQVPDLLEMLPYDSSHHAEF